MYLIHYLHERVSLHLEKSTLPRIQSWKQEKELRDLPSSRSYTRTAYLRKSEREQAQKGNRQPHQTPKPGCTDVCMYTPPRSGSLGVLIEWKSLPITSLHPALYTSTDFLHEWKKKERSLDMSPLHASTQTEEKKMLLFSEPQGCSLSSRLPLREDANHLSKFHVYTSVYLSICPVGKPDALFWNQYIRSAYRQIKIQLSSNMHIYIDIYIYM